MSQSDHSSAFTTPRLVLKKVLAKSQHEGDGAVVRRGIGRSELKNLDPFLMLDHFSVSPPAGFPDHPHRGFEIVTYMLELAGILLDTANLRDPRCSSKDKYMASLLINGAPLITRFKVSANWHELYRNFNRTASFSRRKSSSRNNTLPVYATLT
ncbi:hypothetical protein GYH30_006430 [Glycine max]|nr:hypothetical protein GYH30_006430 [Glycine max]